MEVIVIGSSGTFPRPGGACNGYLVRHGATNMLLDIGTGVLSRLYDSVSPGDLDALVITHLHPDHFLDIYPYRYYLEFCAAPKLPLKVYAPADAPSYIKPLFNEPDPAKFDRVFDFIDIGQAGAFEVGSLSVTGREVNHLKPTYGISVEAGGGRLFYTSDTAYDDRLIDYAGDVDVLLAEATFLAAQAGSPVPHMTTREVGRLAREANVGHLVLTHLWPHFDRRRILAEVKTEFDGRISLADEGLMVEVR
ncbi:MAG: MBL fold metallo-hydrolase [Actinomycetota bacterium]|nr:MBL fold metallo-hydrolase [Actinomycetota bacterium]